MSEKNPILRRWKKMDVSLRNYQVYITKKPQQFSLTLVDLLYISNFKGGNASIHEREERLNGILPAYCVLLLEIDNQFKNKILAEVSLSELHVLISIVDQLCQLSEDQETQIDGFKASYLSALLHAYFPHLLPILDKRILVNLQLVDVSNINSAGQVVNIRRFYPKLLQEVYQICKDTGKTIRQIDEELFQKELPKWARKNSAHR